MYFRDNLKDDLNIYFSMYNLNRGNILEVIKSVEKLLDIKQKELDAHLEANKGSVISEGEIPDDLAKDFAEAMEHLRTGPYFNLLLMKAFSFLEFSLADLCRVFEKHGKSKVQFINFRSKQRGIDKAKEYFRDEFEIILSEQKDWSVIKNYQTIRNLIVHNNANVFKNYDLPLSEQKEWAIINVLEKDISVSETGFIFIKDIVYIKKLVDIAQVILSNSASELENIFIRGQQSASSQK